MRADARDVRVVILKSTVDRVFCAGADLKERAAMKEVEVASFVHGLRTAFGDLEVCFAMCAAMPCDPTSYG